MTHHQSVLGKCLKIHFLLHISSEFEQGGLGSFWSEALIDQFIFHLFGFLWLLVGNLVLLLWIPRILLQLLPPQPLLAPQQNIRYHILMKSFQEIWYNKIANGNQSINLYQLFLFRPFSKLWQTLRRFWRIFDSSECGVGEGGQRTKQHCQQAFVKTCQVSSIMTFSQKLANLCWKPF